jgi:hypothetical protein
MTEEQQIKLNTEVDLMNFIDGINKVCDALWMQTASRDFHLDWIKITLPDYLFPELEAVETDFGNIKINRISTMVCAVCSKPIKPGGWFFAEGNNDGTML